MPAIPYTKVNCKLQTDTASLLYTISEMGKQSTLLIMWCCYGKLQIDNFIITSGSYNTASCKPIQHPSCCVDITRHKSTQPLPDLISLIWKVTHWHDSFLINLLLCQVHTKMRTPRLNSVDFVATGRYDHTN